MILLKMKRNNHNSKKAMYHLLLNVEIVYNVLRGDHCDINNLNIVSLGEGTSEELLGQFSKHLYDNFIMRSGLLFSCNLCGERNCEVAQF